MSQSRTGELEDVVRRLGAHINLMYTKIDEINSRIKETEDSVTHLRAEVENNNESTSNFKENYVLKTEFDEFVSRLTESLKVLLPPLPTETENK